MTSRRRRTAAAETPVADEATNEVPQGGLTSQLSDEEIMERIKAEQARRASQPKPARATIQTVYSQMVALVASATGRKGTVPRLSETTAAKLMELTLMWELNNRQTQQPNNLLPSDEGFEAEEPEESGPVPDEIITAADEAAA